MSNYAENPESFIPFNRPSVEGRELDYIKSAVEHGHTSASGPFTALAVDELKAATGAADVLLTTSCTAALEMSAILLDIRPGDTIVAPSFGFVTTALAFVRAGAKVRFCDIEPDTLSLDVDRLADIMDDTVKAVVPIHYSGIGGRIADMCDVVERWPRADIVEDNAHGLFGTYRGEPLGSFGRFSTLSFHETKNFICGEGGALVVNDEADIDRAHVIYDKGTNRRAFLHGQVDKYSWQDVGSSFGMADVLAAYLYGQLEEKESILRKRRHVFDHYFDALSPFVDSHGIRLPVVPDDCEQAYHMFYVLLPDAEMRNHVLKAMNDDDIYATFHYVPLHSSPGGVAVAAEELACPVTDDVSRRLLRLPFFTSLGQADLDRVTESFISAVEQF
ncbi:MAG: dTDP-4-amino-4,6-dideoxygalactose transaminase [Acidimicrobiales bacterium]